MNGNKVQTIKNKVNNAWELYVKICFYLCPVFVVITVTILSVLGKDANAAGEWLGRIIGYFFVFLVIGALMKYKIEDTYKGFAVVFVSLWIIIFFIGFYEGFTKGLMMTGVLN